MKQGRASHLVDVGDGTVLRSGGDPERESRVMDVARANGFPVPQVHDVRPDALVLERVSGPTMVEDLRRRPWRFRAHARTLADLHARLHTIAYDGVTLVHFDLHPENVLLSERGPVVIDWTNAHGGDPASDVAMTWLILATSGGVPGRIMARLFARAAGVGTIRRGLPRAREFRLADPNVRADERVRVQTAVP